MPMPRPIAASPIADRTMPTLPTFPSGRPERRPQRCVADDHERRGEHHADPPGHGDGDEAQAAELLVLEIGDRPDDRTTASTGRRRPWPGRRGGRRWTAGRRGGWWWSSELLRGRGRCGADHGRAARTPRRQGEDARADREIRPRAYAATDPVRLLRAARAARRNRRPSAIHAAKKTNRPRSCHGSAAAPSATSAPAAATRTAIHPPPETGSAQPEGERHRTDPDQQQADGEEQEGRLRRRAGDQRRDQADRPEGHQQARAGQGDSPRRRVRCGPAAGSRPSPSSVADERDGSGGPGDQVDREPGEVGDRAVGALDGPDQFGGDGGERAACRRRWPRRLSGGRQRWARS